MDIDQIFGFEGRVLSECDSGKTYYLRDHCVYLLEDGKRAYVGPVIDGIAYDRCGVGLRRLGKIEFFQKDR